MRKMAKGRVRCVVGLAVVVGLVTLLSPLPFTSSNPRLKGLNPTRPHPTTNPYNPSQEGGKEKRSGNSGSAGEQKANAVDYSKNSAGYFQSIGKSEKLILRNEILGKDTVNTGESERNQDSKLQTIDKNKDNAGGNHGNSGENQKNTNENGNTGANYGNPGANQINLGVNEETTRVNSEANQQLSLSPVEKKVEEKMAEVKVEQEELELSHDSYIESVPPKEWLEVEKIKPTERGGGGGKDRGGKKRKTKRPWMKKPLENPVGLSPKELQERAASLPVSSPVRAFLEEQTRRVAHVAKSCRSFMPSLAEVVAGSRGPPVGLLSVRDIIYDRKNQLTFCPVYKAASTSLTITLLQLAGHWTAYTEKQPLQKVVKMFYPKLTGLAAASITSNTTHFMVVRHPLERLLSCYRDKFQLATKDYYYHMIGEKIVRRFREGLKHVHSDKVIALQEEVRLALMKYRSKYGEGAWEGDFLNLPHNPFANPVGPTFPEFAQYVSTTKYDDEHWRTYTAHCAPCTLTYDFVLRFESLQEETKWFLEYLNRTGEVTPRWDNHNRKAETSQVFCQYYSQLPLELIDRLVEKYKKDLIMYEYDAEDYRKCARDYPSVSSGDGGGDVTTVGAATTTANGDLKT